MRKQFKDDIITLDSGVEKNDYTKTSFCPRHTLVLENITNPTENDKKKIEKIRLIPGKVENPDGSIRFFRSCHKCFFSVPIESTNEGANIEGFVVK